MSLNDIHLPIPAIVDLYKDSLVEMDASVTSVTAEKKEIKEQSSLQAYLGNNKKQVVVIVNYNDAVFLPDDKLAFLTTVLTACKLNLDDIAIVNFNNCAGKSYKDIFKEIPAKSALLFGIFPETLSLPVNFPFFQVQHFDSINYLSSPPLDEIEKDQTLKGQLWTSLRKIFNL
jgi:hypothetical protein